MGSLHPERGIGGFALTVLTPWGKETYQVFLEETAPGWTARIVTLPNRIWVGPGGREALKFTAATAHEAESAAADFIEEARLAAGRRLWAPRPGQKDPVAEKGREIVLAQPQTAERFARRLLLRFGQEQPDRPGVTGNLSETGIFIITDRPGQVGSDLEIDLRMPDQPVVLRGEVVWIRTERLPGMSVGCGVKLVRRPPEYMKQVRGLGMPIPSWRKG
jgi:hypothetical protein